MTRPGTTECDACEALMPCCVPCRINVYRFDGTVRSSAIQYRCHRCRSVPDAECEECYEYSAATWPVAVAALLAAVVAGWAMAVLLVAA